MEKYIGIDLGTSNSVITVCDEKGETTVIPNLDGSLITPSIVYYDGEKTIVGEKVKPMYKLGNPNTIGGFKTDMGSGSTYTLGGKKFTPTELSSLVLKYLKESAEAYLGEPVTEVVITVPAYFYEIQRTQTRLAAEMVGLTVKRVIDEPTASALSFGLSLEEEKNILVYDFGGGTFDVSLLAVDSGTIDVIGKGGDNHLGGNDIDEAIATTIAKSLKKRQGWVPASEKALRTLREIARQTKEKMSTNDYLDIDLTPLGSVDDQFDISKGNLEITKKDFIQIIKKILVKTVGTLQDVVSESGMTMDEIDYIMLVGGSTKITEIKPMLEAATGIKVLQNEIDPDLIVSVGASIQASIMEGGVGEMLLLDVTPFNLSVMVEGGASSVVIAQNSAIPKEGYRVYTTTYDNQTEIDFKVYQGNSSIASENEFLGLVTIDNIKPEKAGRPQFEMVLSIDQNGELHISATELNTGRTVETTRKI